jgi:hypothetical protein
MSKKDFNKNAAINYDDRALFDFTITLTPRGDDAQKRAEAFQRQLERWPLIRQNLPRHKLAKAEAGVNDKGQPVLTVQATELLIMDIQRQFAGDILKVDPQVDVIPPSHRKRPVDPFDVRYW